MTDHSLQLPDEAGTIAAGQRLAPALPEAAFIYIDGDLGAGKTTLVRALLRALGHEGPVRSPTYTLIEPYELGGRNIYHLDLYRLGSPLELEDIGFRDLLAEPCLLLVEWPQRGGGMLPPPDLRLRLTAAGAGRLLVLQPASETGAKILKSAGFVS
jgi:tRNA threonylcarbamoyladenosine biosynthesis protein TsaE